MIALAILFALTVLAPLIGIGPPMKRGAHASNSIVSVVAPPRSSLHARGIEAQEAVEWWLAWLVGCMVAVPVALLVPEPMLANGLVVVTAFLGNALARKITGHFDLVGHNVEIIIEERAGFLDYRIGEISRMIGPRGNQRGLTFDQANRALQRWEWLARFALAAFQFRYR